MAYYVKVKPSVKERIVSPVITGKKAADGNIILFQSDLIGVFGLTLSDRAAAVGGALLTPEEARKEIDGTCEHPAECYDPEENEEEAEGKENDSQQIPEVDKTKEESEVDNG